MFICELNLFKQYIYIYICSIYIYIYIYNVLYIIYYKTYLSINQSMCLSIYSYVLVPNIVEGGLNTILSKFNFLRGLLCSVLRKLNKAVQEQDLQEYTFIYILVGLLHSNRSTIGYNDALFTIKYTDQKL